MQHLFPKAYGFIEWVARQKWLGHWLFNRGSQRSDLHWYDGSAASYLVVALWAEYYDSL